MDSKRIRRLLHVREVVRDVRRGELAQAEAVLDGARRAELEAAARVLDAERGLMELDGFVGVHDLEMKAMAIVEARDGELSAQAEVARTASLREERAGELQSSEFDLRALERFGEKVAVAERKDADRREQRDLDERSLQNRRRA